MKNAKSPSDTLRREYTRATSRAGWCAASTRGACREGTNIVRLDPDIAAAFPTSEAVNEALGGLLKAARSRGRRSG